MAPICVTTPIHQMHVKLLNYKVVNQEMSKSSTGWV
jgi:hypothetical protein